MAIDFLIKKTYFLYSFGVCIHEFTRSRKYIGHNPAEICEIPVRLQITVNRVRIKTEKIKYLKFQYTISKVSEEPKKKLRSQ